MLESSISALIPHKDSEIFYKIFYNQYNLIQINDTLLSLAFDQLNDEEICKIIEMLRGYNEDHDYLAVWTLGAGIMNPSLMKRRAESENGYRGLSVDLFEKLQSIGVDPIEWYKSSTEFLMLYAICEQSIKEFYLSSGGDESKSMQEDKIIYRLFDSLDSREIKMAFLDELKDATSEGIQNQNQIQAVWMYFTVLRHCLAHSGGRRTQRIEDRLKDVIEKNKKELNAMEEALVIEFVDKFADGFFVNLFDTEILVLSECYLNFFRNFIVAIMESLEKAFHPNEYVIRGFDPYKL